MNSHAQNATSVSKPRAHAPLYSGWDEFLGWMVPLVPIKAGWVGVHILVLAWIATEAAVAALTHGAAGAAEQLLLLGAWMGVVLAREVARAIVLRLIGGIETNCAIWPLGGLALPLPGLSARPMIAECGGVAFGFLMIPLIALWAISLGLDTRLLLTWPTDPRAAGLVGWPKIVWWLHAANLSVLAINLCIPMLPLDAGRWLHAWRSRRVTTAEAAMTTARATWIIASLIFIVAAVAGETRVLLVSTIAGLAGAAHWRRALFFAEGLGSPHPTRDHTLSDDPDSFHTLSDHWLDQSSSDLEPGTLPEVDAVLRKVSTQGLAALSPIERRVLEAETTRLRAASQEHQAPNS
ncbi:MAG: hypothetical protein IPK69_13160 [Phycisphaerales bacterium]|nr:MAG: hypothetical protein IPK69_13160 [Phycisphaerales bacterium]